MKFTLRFSLGMVSVGLVLLTSAFLGGVTYWTAQQILRDNLRTRMSDLISSAALQLDATAHQDIQKPDDETTPVYRAFKQKLQGIRNISKDIRFIYTSRLDGQGRVVFVVDAEESADNVSHVGDVYAEASPLMRALFAKPVRAVVEEQFSTDRWGTFLSSYAPFFAPDGRLEGVVGMDISADQVLAYERQHLNVILMVVALFSLFGMLLGSIMSRRIARSLLLLEQDMSRIQQLDLTTELTLTSRIQEIVSMRDTVQNMKNSLRSFRKYVPADLVMELVQLRQEAVLGAELRSVTLFFSDIAGFTTLTEQMTPEQLSQRMGIYFEAMTRTLMHHQGTVDKFIGDAVMAFWGAPKPQDSHALLACQAALRCQQALDVLAADWAQQGIPPFPTRIGLCTGEALVGNMGYAERMSYTALGDVVNLASRLEGLNKFYGTRILIGESTHAQVRSVMATRCLGIVAVKGKTRGVRIYELVADRNEATADVLGFLQTFDAGMEAYLARDFGAAADHFRSCLAQRAEDPPARLMLDTCHKLISQPPADDWTGVITMHEK